jgi:O-antigen ligase
MVIAKKMSQLRKITAGWSWADYSAMSILVVFAAFNKMMPPLMIIAGLSLFLIRTDLTSFKEKWSIRHPYIWFILFFLSHVAGLWNTTNMDFAIADIGMKASLILIPLFFMATRLNLNRNHIINGYLIALLLATLICFGYAIFRSIYNAEDNQWAYFTESYFSYMMHRSYFATYLALGTLMAVYMLFKSENRKWLYFVMIALFAVSTVLTASKAGVLILALLMIPLGFYLMVKRFNVFWGSFSLVVMFIFGFIALQASSNLSERFEKMITGLTETKTENNTAVESNSSRIIMWSTSSQLFKENLMTGVGTGDVKDELNKRNTELGNLGVVEKNLNAHNQYLNTGVQLGLLGLIPLLMVLITSLGKAMRTRDIILSLVIFTFATTMLFESFLETQAGVIPVTYILLLFVLIPKPSGRNSAF